MSTLLPQHSAAQRGVAGPSQPGLAIIRVFTGIMLSRDMKVSPVAGGREDEGSICLSRPKATLIIVVIIIIITIIQQGRNIGGKSRQQSLKMLHTCILLHAALILRSHSRTCSN